MSRLSRTRDNVGIPIPPLAEIAAADGILNALPLPVLQVDADNQVMEANAAAESYFQLSRSALRRHTLADLLPGQQQHSDGSESAAATAQQLEQRVTEACTVALAHLFGESIAASLLASFRRPALHLADVQRL